MMTDLVGQQLGNYQLIRLLGRGGFARVYLGEHTRLGTQAAIKVLAAHLTEADVEGFLKEARTIACLEHPHIVRIFDFVVEEEFPFLIMQYAPHGTLRQRYPKGTQLVPATILGYLKQLGDAVQCAHDAKLIHRDIKPENLLLGRRGEVLLSDFGIAVVLRSSQSQHPQDLAGTLHYMAPEQIQGKPRPASDQYSLGVIAYEWLTGTHPFHGTATEIATQHLLVPPPPLRDRLPDIDPKLEAVVLKALEKDPYQRFENVQAFVEAFEQACVTTSSSLLSSVGDPTYYAEATLPAGGLRSVGLLPPTQSPHKTFSRRALLLGGAGIALIGTGVGGAWLLLGRRRAAGDTLVVYTQHSNTVHAVAWSPDGQRIASAGDFVDRTVRIWDATTGDHTFVYRGHDRDVNAVSWSPDGQFIASGGGNLLLGGENTVQVWKPRTGERVFTYSGHTGAVNTVAWSPDGQLIASAGWDKTVRVWYPTSGVALTTYSKHTNAINAIAWSPDSKKLASASLDQTVQVWDVASGTALFTYTGHANSVTAISWSPDGQFIASGCGNVFFGGDHTVQVWHAETGKLVLTYRGHSAAVNSVAWSPTKHILASGSQDKTIHVWDGTSGALLFTYHGHTLGVNGLAWSPDGTLIASAGNDGVARVWQAP